MTWWRDFLISAMSTAVIVVALNAEFPSVPMNWKEAMAVGFSVSLTLAACRAAWSWTRGR